MRQLYNRSVFCLLACCFGGATACAQDPLTAPLPDSLRQGAAMVRRLDQMEITVESLHKVRIHRKWINTILNSTGDQYSGVYTFYDKFHDLSSVTATWYDADGKVTKKIKKSDLEDAPVSGPGMLAMDVRVKYYPYIHHSYPYTLQYEEEVILNNLFQLPAQWFPQVGPNTSLLNCTLIVHVPASIALHHKEYNFPGEARVTGQRGERTYTWELRDRPAHTPEAFSVAWRRQEPCVRLAAGNFEWGGHKGSADDWTRLGQFTGSLFENRDQLPVEARQKVHQLADGLSTDQAKVAALYSWLQQNTHYVGIELGIGGWQPYDAAYVYTRKYGDCKALANYMVALCKEAGIHAWPVLINAGPEPPPVDSDFACPSFNHCIAVALAGKDSVWLECTSNRLPAGYLGSFTADREGLLLDGSGGHLVHTPVYGVGENRVIRRLDGSVSGSGALEAALKLAYSGLEQEAPQSMIDRLSRRDLLEEERQSLGCNDCTISDWNYTSVASSLPSLEESMHVSAEHFATLSGSRLIVVPGRFLRRSSRVSAGGPARQTEIELSTSVDETDSIVLRLPPGYVPEHLPAADLSYPFGVYSLHSHFDHDVLTVTCHFIERKGVYSPNDYERMVRLFDLAWREENGQVVFVKQ